MTKKFNSGTPTKIPLLPSAPSKPPPPFKHANKTTPDRFASNASSVVGIAFGAGMVALVASVLTVWGLYSINVPVKIGASGLCAGPVMLFVLLAGLILVFKNRDLVTTIETIIGHDLNQDGWVGAPQSTEIVLPHSNRGGWERWKFPFSQELLRDWGLAALEGQSTAYPTWQDRFAWRPDKRDGEKNYRAFRKLLTDGRLADENGTHSIVLTERGIELFERYVYDNDDALTPLLRDVNGNRSPG